ncbi:protein FAM210A-like, partial [Drosophila subobscura]|uniref:protein FAM210A-like n=1 Tax=Drosophila subobscura TaxID=7241 RepID=UPI00155B3B50
QESSFSLAAARQQLRQPHATEAFAKSPHRPRQHQPQQQHQWPAAAATSNKTDSIKTSDLFGDATNMGLFVRFRHMYKQYWYVLIPVHCVTSMCWFGGFYYLSKVGVDVPALLQYAHLSDTIIERVQSSDMGHFAIAFLCFKVVTPLRYSVTLGGTTLSIKFLVKRGYLKPIPSKKQLIKMYEKKKATRRAKADKEEKDGSK